MNIDQPTLWNAIPDKIRRDKQKYFQYADITTSLKKGRIWYVPWLFEYPQVTSRVFKVRVMVLEYAPRIPGTRRGFRVRYGSRRSFRVRGFLEF